MGSDLDASISRRSFVTLTLLALSPALSRAADPPGPARKPAPIAAVFELNAETGAWRKLFDLPDDYRCNSPRVSPDSRQLVFDGWNKIGGKTNTDAEVFITNLDGSGMKSICTGAMPTLSPDGKHVACSRYRANQGVWIVSLDGHKEEQLDPNGWGIQWSPDGASVAWTRRNNVVIRTVATGQERLLFPETGSPWPAIAWNMSWSADGRRIALLGYQPNSQYELATVDTQGAEFGFNRYSSGRFVPGLTWNAEKRPIVVPDKLAGAYRIVEFDPAKPERLPTPIAGIPADSKATSASWTPDGSRLIVICNFN